MTKSTTKRRGISFVEVMVTVVILATGLTGVFRAYITSMDYLSYLTDRLYFDFFLDQRITGMQQEFGVAGKVSQSTHSAMETVEIGQKPIMVEIRTRFEKVDNLENLLHVTTSVIWAEHDRTARVTRQAYLRR